MEKVTLFFVTLLVLAISGVIFINPKGIESTQRGEEPIFEFIEYSFYNIKKTGVDEYLVSDSAYHYADRDIIQTISYYKRTDAGIDLLQSDRATVYQNYTDFNGSVLYLQKEGYKLISKDVRYNSAAGTITGNTPFSVTSSRGDFNGSSFEINVSKRDFKAQNIRSIFNL